LKIKTKLILVAVMGVSMIFGMSVFSLYQFREFNKSISSDIPQAVEQIENTSYLDSLSQFIRYYDEVLTQSARNYAFTGDIKWKDRYNQVAPDLDTKIKEAIQKGDNEDKKFFSDINASNLALVEMEQNSINLVDEGKAEQAVQILESQKYWDQKEIYKKGLEAYIARRGTSYGQALVASTQILDKVRDNYQGLNDMLFKAAISFFVAGIILAIFFLYVIYFSILNPLSSINKASLQIAKGNLEQGIEIKSDDEIGELASNFNKMTGNLKESRMNIEEKIKSRTRDLEQLNKSMVGRELKMIELKKEIEKLKQK